MSLNLTLDVNETGQLCWNGSAINVPARYAAGLRGLAIGTVVTADCEWKPGGMTLASTPKVETRAPEDPTAQLAHLAQRGNWEGVLALAQKDSALLGWHARALLELRQEDAFRETFVRLVAQDFGAVDTSDRPSGVWKMRSEISEEGWAGLPRAARVRALQHAWEGMRRSRNFADEAFAGFRDQTLVRLFRAVEPEHRPPLPWHAGGPPLEVDPTQVEEIVWCALNARLLATEREWQELASVVDALGKHDSGRVDARLKRLGKRLGKQPATVPAFVRAVAHAVSLVQPATQIENAFNTLELLLRAAAPAQASAFLRAYDDWRMLVEARALLPKRSPLRKQLTAIRYRGSIEVHYPDGIVAQTATGWAAMVRHNARWMITEGSRDDVLAAMPDVLFAEATAALLGR